MIFCSHECMRTAPPPLTHPTCNGLRRWMKIENFTTIECVHCRFKRFCGRPPARAPGRRLLLAYRLSPIFSISKQRFCHHSFIWVITYHLHTDMHKKWYNLIIVYYNKRADNAQLFVWNNKIIFSVKKIIFSIVISSISVININFY